MLKIKRLFALLACVTVCFSSIACAEETADVIRRLLAAGETSSQQQAAVNDVRTTVDFELLAALNPDCVGWLYQPESGLNQPIMQHETDDWYRERGFDEVKIYKTGSVYLHAEDSIEDDVLILRGQARAEGCLGVIPDWREQEKAEQRSAFRLLTPEGDYQAEVFACVAVAKNELGKWLPPETKWRIPYWLRDTVLPNSLIQCDPLSQPDENDRMLMIAAEHLNGSITLVMATMRPIVYTTDAQCSLTQMELDARETQNGVSQVGPAGELMIYAQNDPLYALMHYESAIRNGVHRDFGGGGCGPTAMAIIIANVVDREKLPLIGQHAKNELGNLFCTCSVNRVYCDHTHVPYQLKTPEEYLRYLPVAVADFAAGNNEWEYVARRVDSQGTNIKFVDFLCQAYGITAEPVSGLETALEMMKEKTGKGLILTSALRGSPLTNSSHFVIIAGVDEEYFYIIDPMRRTEEEYLKTDKRGILELVSPGVVRIKLADYGRSDLSPVSYFSME